MIICFYFAPFEGFKNDIFRLIKQLWAASVERKSPGCCFVSSRFLSPGVYPHPLSLPFLSFHHFPSPSLSISCQLTVVPLPLSVSWPIGHIRLTLRAVCRHRKHHRTGSAIKWHFNFFGHPSVLRSSRCRFQGVENISVSPCPHQ